LGANALNKRFSSLLILLTSLYVGFIIRAQAPPSSSAPELTKQAEESYRTGKLDAAIRLYQSALQVDPASDVAYAGLVRAYLKQEQVQNAFDAATKGLAQAPDSALTHAAMGEVYFRRAQMGESEQEFLKSVNRSNPAARGFLGLSRLYDAYSLHAKARAMLEKAHSLDPSDPDISRRWMRTLSRTERIKWLEAYLAAPSEADDQDTRESYKNYLDILKEREARPDLTCKLVSNVSSTETSLKPMLTGPTRLHGFGLEVKVNGHSSRLLLDTGASGLLINRKLAQKANVQPLITSKVGGIGDQGATSSYIGYAESIKVGELEFHNCLVEVSDKRSVLGDDGLIGADVFSHYLVTVDLLWQKLRLAPLPTRPGEKEQQASLLTDSDSGSSASEAPKPAPDGQAKSADTKTASSAAPSGPQDRYIAPEMQSYTKIFRFGHELLIPTKVGNAEPKLFLIDTGASMNSISPEAAREVTKVHSDYYTTIQGLSGNVKKVYSADKAVLQFSHFKQENQDLITFDLSNISKHTGTEVSGILGFTTLRMLTMTIDYRDGLVDFSYHPAALR
jgi:tetratricopeptide (TPR) repeat protein